jgi:hypothetical protein
VSAKRTAEACPKNDSTFWVDKKRTLASVRSSVIQLRQVVQDFDERVPLLQDLKDKVLTKPRVLVWGKESVLDDDE